MLEFLHFLSRVLFLSHCMCFSLSGSFNIYVHRTSKSLSRLQTPVSARLSWLLPVHVSMAYSIQLATNWKPNYPISMDYLLVFTSQGNTLSPSSSIGKTSKLPFWHYSFPYLPFLKFDFLFLRSIHSLSFCLYHISQSYHFSFGGLMLNNFQSGIAKSF